MHRSNDQCIRFHRDRRHAGNSPSLSLLAILVNAFMTMSVAASMAAPHPDAASTPQIASAVTPAAADEAAIPLELDRAAANPLLEAFGLAGRDLPHDLFLVRTRGELPETDGVTVHGARKGVFLVSGDPRAMLNLAQKGCAVMPMPESAAVEPPAREWAWIDTPDPDIEAMVAQVAWPAVSDKIQQLVDFGTRYSFAPNHGEVAESIRDAFAACGLPATLHPYDFYGATMWNVEATQIGTLYPNSYVVICGHFDSISEQPMTLAPGADDNATGVAAVMTAAEILSQHTFEYSIRYVCFSGEELGLVGSYFYTADVRRNNVDIVGALNFDMLGYWEPGVEKDLEIETNQASLWLAQAVVNAADLYTGTPYELHVYDGAWWGDHFRFWLNGYAAVNHEESWDWEDPDFNPYYHSSEDLPMYVDPDFTVGNIRIAVASVATLASAEPPVMVSFDMRPGSCPNPFNPASRGVINALLLGSEEFDVRDVNLSSIRLEDAVSPLKVRVADMGSAERGNGHPCADMSPDGFADLSLRFATEDIAATLGAVADGDEVNLTLRGRLFDGTVIEGEDIVAIVGGGSEPSPVKQPAPAPSPTAMLTSRESPPPQTLVLHQNTPNPFNPSTSILLNLPPGSGAVTLRIYDLSGRLIRTLLDGETFVGQRAFIWDGSDEAGRPVVTGTYIYRLTGGAIEQTRKMMLLK
jgi:hypothetical protein